MEKMNTLVFKTMKIEYCPPAVLRCCLCLASENDVKLSAVNLNEFYNFFKPCGIGVFISEEEFFSLVCQYCCKRSSQCLQFLKMVRSSELIIKNLNNEVPITDELLKSKRGAISVPIQLSSCLSSCYLSGVASDGDLGVFDVAASTAISHNNEAPARILSKKDSSLFKNAVSKSQISFMGEKNSFTAKHEVSSQCLMQQNMGECSISDDAEVEYNESNNDEVSKEMPATKEGSTNESDGSIQAIFLTREEQLAELASLLQCERFLNRQFRCYKCAVSFHEQRCLDAHNDLHREDRGAFECDICYRRFKKKELMRLHGTLHRNRWRCLRCDKYMTNKLQMTVHRAECSRSEPVQCEVCAKLFKHSLNLKKHMSRQHHNTKAFTCDVCGKTFKHKQLIVLHLRSHTNEKPHSCHICGKKSAQLSSHKVHMNIHECKDMSDPNLYCVECDKHFKSKYIRNVHFKTSRKHVGILKHECPECGERFASPCSVRAHRQRVHARTKPSVCALCDKSYYSQRALASHARAKHSGRPPSRDKVCSVCGKAFSANSTLKNHMRIHTGERPFACGYCPATFGFKASLYTHTRLKHKTSGAAQAALSI